MGSLLINFACIAAVALGATSWTAPGHASETLASWNDTGPKKAIVAFVERVTTQGSPDFVPVAERIATFDNDGTLWAEQPLYFQFLFAIDRINALAPRHPEWRDKEPFVSLLKGEPKAALAAGDHALIDIVTATHAGMTSDEFEQVKGRGNLLVCYGSHKAAQSRCLSKMEGDPLRRARTPGPPQSPILTYRGLPQIRLSFLAHRGT
jgi:hypothetical protein